MTLLTPGKETTMNAMVMKIYDKPMCCSTGVCGSDVDPDLVRFSADLEWLARQGVTVERYNPAQEPRAFVTNPVVRRALQEKGDTCLPLVLWGDEVVIAGTYPDRTALAKTTGLPRSADEKDGVS